MRRTLLRWLLILFPQRLFTACLGRLARARCSRRLIPLYARWYQIDDREADLPLACYPTLLDFFCRGLANGARPVAACEVVSPVDGTVSELGRLDHGQLLQAKGCMYSLAALLADAAAAMRYEGGHYVTLYLSPRDYHRIHMPVHGRLTAWRYVPGKLFPVNTWGVACIAGLFTQNERLITFIETPRGECALVKVGAAGVGSVRTAYSPALGGPWRRRRQGILTGQVDRELPRGAELGRFEFGSTVILLFTPGMISRFCVQSGQSIRMGEPLAQWSKE